MKNPGRHPSHSQPEGADPVARVTYVAALIGDLEDFLEVPADDLEADRRPVLGEPGRNGGAQGCLPPRRSPFLFGMRPLPFGLGI